MFGVISLFIIAVKIITSPYSPDVYAVTYCKLTIKKAQKWRKRRGSRRRVEKEEEDRGEGKRRRSGRRVEEEKGREGG